MSSKTEIRHASYESLRITGAVGRLRAGDCLGRRQKTNGQRCIRPPPEDRFSESRRL
jgi:hypothetical protein